MGNCYRLYFAGVLMAVFATEAACESFIRVSMNAYPHTHNQRENYRYELAFIPDIGF